MSAEDNAPLARARAQAAWNQHDLDAAVCLCHPVGSAIIEGFGEAHGLDGFRSVAGAFLAAVPDMRVSWTATHQRRFSGSSYWEYVAVREVIMLRVTDGRLRRHGR